MRVDERLVFRLKSGRGYVDGRRFSDPDLAAIPEDTVLLNLENADISDVGVSSLPDLPRLRCIDLDGTLITDASMERLSSFRNLEEIWVEGTAISDRGLAALHGLTHLRFISILDCDHISDEAVGDLQHAIRGIEIH